MSEVKAQLKLHFLLGKKMIHYVSNSAEAGNIAV